MHGVEHNCLHLLLGSFLLFCLLCLVTRVKLELAWLMPVAYTPTAFPFGASCSTPITPLVLVTDLQCADHRTGESPPLHPHLFTPRNSRLAVVMSDGRHQRRHALLGQVGLCLIAGVGRRWAGGPPGSP